MVDGHVLEAGRHSDTIGFFAMIPVPDGSNGSSYG